MTTIVATYPIPTRIRIAVYQRDNWSCICGYKSDINKSGDIEAHHIIPIEEGGEHSLENLRTLCVRCHKVLHRCIRDAIKYPSFSRLFLDRYPKYLVSRYLTNIPT